LGNLTKKEENGNLEKIGRTTIENWEILEPLVEKEGKFWKLGKKKKIGIKRHNSKRKENVSLL